MIDWLKQTYSTTITNLKTRFPGPLWSWLGHTLTTMVVSIVFAFLINPAQFGLMVGACLAFMFFLIKEIKDMNRHKAMGSWDKPVMKYGVSGRVDGAGDLLGPSAYFLATIVSYLMG